MYVMVRFIRVILRLQAVRLIQELDPAAAVVAVVMEVRVRRREQPANHQQQLPDLDSRHFFKDM